MKKLFLLLIIAIALSYYFYPEWTKGLLLRTWSAGWARVEEWIFRGARELGDLEKKPVIAELKKEVIGAPPLRARIESPQAFLTRAGVIAATNSERRENGLAALAESTLLTSVASSKLKDMFEKQYFAHVSPTGEDVGGVAGRLGYRYIVIGENLALGNYADDRALVRAWMESPGHRANILNSRYREIGVAVAKGLYQGEETWLAVEVFALPSTACPEPDEALKEKIRAYQHAIQELSGRADALRSELEAMQPRSKSEYEAYNRTVDEYNALARQINTLISEARASIEVYNTAARAFNECAGG